MRLRKRQPKTPDPVAAAALVDELDTAENVETLYAIDRAQRRLDRLRRRVERDLEQRELDAKR